MCNSTVSAPFRDPDPASAQWLGVLYAMYAAIGIPLNLLVLILTITNESVRAIPISMCVFSIALADLMLLVSILSSTLWAITFDITVCKVMGVGIYIFIVMSMMLPACLAICRHAGLSSVHELPIILRPLKTRKGIFALNAMFWTYGIFFMWPFIAYDKFGLDVMGSCGVTEIDTAFLWTYYMIFIVSPLFIAYAVTFFFYRKLDQWVQRTSALMTISSHTHESLTITRNMMRMIKWLLFVPVVCFYPAHTCEMLLRLFPNLISIGTARFFMIFFCLPHVCDPIITLIFVKRYRMALVSLLLGEESIPNIRSRVVTRGTTNGTVAIALHE